MTSGSSYRCAVPDEHIYNYANAKAAFLQEVGYVILEKKLQTRVKQRKEDIETIINDIKRGRHHYKKYFTEKCQVVNENGTDILCRVITRQSNKTFKVSKIKQILCIDEIFDILFELHMQKPYLDEDEITKHFNNCILFTSFINLFWKSCETCNTILKNIDMHFRLIGEITILNMVSSDGTFTDILMYIERNTSFVLLRPLKFLSTEEFAYELLSIFADFGTATYVDSDIFRETFEYNNILKTLKSLVPPFRIPTMYANIRNHKIEVTARKANKMLVEWMENTGSSNWAIGAHVVQWLMNTNKVVDTYIRSRVVSGPLQSPYHAMFGLLPRTDLIKFKNKRQSGTLNKEKVLVDCSECSLPIYKVFKCSFCKRLCHFSCCVRYVEQGPDGAILINKCFSCANTNMSVDEEVILGT